MFSFLSFPFEARLFSRRRSKDACSFIGTHGASLLRFLNINVVSAHFVVAVLPSLSKVTKKSKVSSDVCGEIGLSKGIQNVFFLSKPSLCVFDCN